MTNCPDCGDVLIHQSDHRPRLEFADIGELPWPIAGDDLLTKGRPDWWMVACLGWSIDEWVTYAVGYRKAAGLIIDHIAANRADQDFLIWPFVLCWRHHVELQLKRLNRSLRELLKNLPPPTEKPTHSIRDLWSDFRGLTEETGYGPSSTDLDNAQGVLDQLDSLDPNSETFRYPASSAGRPNRPSRLTRLPLGQFHEAMERLACFLEACDAGLPEQDGW
jgi:hypothetical protein